MKEKQIKKEFPLFYAWAYSNYIVVEHNEYIELFIESSENVFKKITSIERFDKNKMIDKENEIILIKEFLKK